MAKARRMVATFVGRFDLGRYPDWNVRIELAKTIDGRFRTKFGSLIDGHHKPKAVVAKDGFVSIIYTLLVVDPADFTRAAKELYALWDPYTVTEHSNRY